jgi:hypothetical protein
MVVERYQPPFLDKDEAEALARVYVGTEEPTTPDAGDLWYNPELPPEDSLLSQDEADERYANKADTELAINQLIEVGPATINPVLLLPLDGTLDGTNLDGPVTATAGGTLRWERWPVTGEPATERRNWCINPSFEVDTVAWYVGQSTIARTASASAFSGGYVGRWTITANAEIPWLWHIPGTTVTDPNTTMISAGQTLRASLRVRGIGTGVGKTLGLQLDFIDAAGVSQLGTMPGGLITIGSEWTTLTAEYVAPATTAMGRVMLRTDTATSVPIGAAFDVDAVQIKVNEPIEDYFDGSTEGDNYVWTGTPDASASVRQWTGQGLVIEEPSTNLVQNPRAATNTTHIEVAGAPTVRIPYDGVFGSTSVEVSATGPANGTLFYGAYGSWSPGAHTITPSVYAKGNCRMDVSAFFQYTDLSYGFGDLTNNQLTGDWTRYIGNPVTSDPDKTINLAMMYVRTASDWAGTATFRATAAQIEEKAYATSFLDGSLGSGYAWTGTAHNSVSTRAAGSLQLPPDGNIDTLSGSVAMRVNNIAPNGLNTRYLLALGVYSVNDFLAIHVLETNFIRFWIKTGTETDTVVLSSVNTLTTPDITVYAEWDRDTIGVSVNGEPLVTSPRLPLSSGTATGSLFIGSDPGSYQQADAMYSTVATFPRALTGTERERVFDLLAAGTLTRGAVPISAELDSDALYLTDPAGKTWRVTVNSAGVLTSTLA